MVQTIGGADTERMEALSDGVFAIVLTLLVLQFEVPDVDAASLPEAVAAQETLLVSYLLSFAVVGIYWIIHHNLFRSITGHDRILLWLNLLFLLSISFLPYPTELMGIYGTRFTWTLYSVNFALVGVLMTAVWAYAVRSGFVDETIGARSARLITIRGLVTPAVFVLSIVVAAVDLSVAFFVPLLIVPLQVIWVRYYLRVTDAATEDRSAESK